MKTMTFILGFFFVLSAQAQFGISKAPTSDLICTLLRSTGRLENGMLLYPCVSNNKEAFGIGFAGIAMNLPKAASQGSSLHLRFHCTVKTPKGVYPFGGETIGFETSYEKHQKFFYAAGEGNYGRCFVSGDAALMKNIQLKTDQSAVVFIPAASR